MPARAGAHQLSRAPIAKASSRILPGLCFINQLLSTESVGIRALEDLLGAGFWLLTVAGGLAGVNGFVQGIGTAWRIVNITNRESAHGQRVLAAAGAGREHIAAAQRSEE